MEADAGAERLAHVPLLLDQRAQRGVVRIRHVLLEAEGGRDELDRHAEHLAQREHHGGRLGMVRPGSSSMDSSRR